MTEILKSDLFTKMGGVKGVSGFNIPSRKGTSEDHIDALPEGLRNFVRRGGILVVDVGGKVFPIEEPMGK